jgi:hypothetical protein
MAAGPRGEGREPSRARSEWAAEHDENVGYLMLGDDIALPVVGEAGGLVASTCLVRGWRPDDVLAERRRRKQIRRHDRRHNVDARRGTSRRRYEAMA